MNASKKTPGRGWVAVACALPALSFGQAADETFTWGLDVGVEYTDNVGRVSVDEESETVGVAGLTLGLVSDRPRLDANIFGNVEYREYLDDAFESELVGGVDALASYAFSPERFYWMAANNFGQIANERSLVDTPENRQNFNYFTTGPDLIFPLGTRNSVRIAGRFSDTYYEERIEDNQSLMGSLALVRRMSDTSDVSLNGSTTTVEYDEEQLFEEYDVAQAFVRYSNIGERTSLTLDVGHTEVTVGEESSDGLLARLELSRAVGARSRVGIEAGTEYSTTGDVFRRDQSVTGVETEADDAIASSDPFQADYGYLTWTTERARTAFYAVLSARKESHETDTLLDRESRAARFTVSREMSPRLSSELTGGYREEEFINRDFNFDEWTVGAGLSWQLAQNVSMRLRLDHIEGSSDDGTRDFEENRAYLGLSYTRSGT